MTRTGANQNLSRIALARRLLAAYGTIPLATVLLMAALHTQVFVSILDSNFGIGIVIAWLFSIILYGFSLRELDRRYSFIQPDKAIAFGSLFFATLGTLIVFVGVMTPIAHKVYFELAKFGFH